MQNSKYPLTIVIVLDHASITGGQAKVAFDSAIGLKRRGHYPILFTAAGPIDDSLTRESIEVVCLGQFDLISNPSMIAAAIQGIWNSSAATELERLLARAPPQRTVVHVHGWAKALSPSIAGPIAASRLPAVYTVHEYFLFCPNGGFYDYQAGHTCDLEPLSARCLVTHCDSRDYARKLWRSARQFVMQRIANLPNVFTDYIFISKFQYGVIEGRLPAHARLHHVSNPVAAVDLGRKERPASGDIVFVGRISPEKGPFLFAEAARMAGIVPTYIGNGPVAAELAARYPESRILGWQSPEDVRTMMRAARALVFPSLWYEGQPLTVMEAKALGTPVIVSDGCAGREEIKDGVSGLWFRSANANALAMALERIKDDVLVTHLSNSSYDEYWSCPPTLDRHLDAILNIYNSLIEKGAAAA